MPVLVPGFENNFTVTYEPPSVQSTEVALGVYGTTIPVGAGKRLVTGVPIWNQGFSNRFSSLDTGVEVPGAFRPMLGIDELKGVVSTFQVSFGYHLAPAAERQRTKIVRLWAGGVLVYDATDPRSIATLNAGLNFGQVKFVVQEGAVDQVAEAHVVANKGPSPGNREMIVATFIGFPTGLFGFGATQPPIVAELVEDVTSTPTGVNFTMLDPTGYPSANQCFWPDWSRSLTHNFRENPDNVWTFQTWDLDTRTQVGSVLLGGLTTTDDGSAIVDLTGGHDGALMVDDYNKKLYLNVNSISNTAPIAEIDYKNLNAPAITKVWMENTAALSPAITQTTLGDGGSVPFPVCGTVLHGTDTVTGNPCTALATGTVGSGGIVCLTQIGGLGDEGFTFGGQTWDPLGADLWDQLEYPLYTRPDYQQRLLKDFQIGTPPGSVWSLPPPKGQIAAFITLAGDRAYMSYVTFPGGVPTFLDHHMFAHFAGYKIRHACVSDQDGGIVLFLDPDAGGTNRAARFDVGFQTVDAVTAALGAVPTHGMLDGDMNPVSLNFNGARGLIPFVANPPIGATSRATWVVDIPFVPGGQGNVYMFKYSRTSNGNMVWDGGGALGVLDLAGGSSSNPSTAFGLQNGGPMLWDDDRGVVHVSGRVDTSRVPFDIEVIGVSAAASIPLNTVLTWLAKRAGYDAADIFVDASLTDPVLGVHLTKPYKVEQLFADMGKVYDFSYFESGDLIKFVRTGTGASFTIAAALTANDLAPIHESGADGNECVLTTFDPDGTSIGGVELTYLDPELDYAKNVQSYISPNIAGTSGTSITKLDLPIIMTATEAYNRVTQIQLGSTEQQVSQTFRLPQRHLLLEPADGISLTFNGFTYSVRLDEITINGDKSLSCLGRNYGFQRASVVAVDDYLGKLPQAVPGANVSRPVIIDAPLLQAELELELTPVVNTGIAGLRQNGWTGGSLMVTQVDQVAWQELRYTTRDIKFATLLSQLPDTTTPNTTDFDTILRVKCKSIDANDVGAATTDQMLQGMNVLAIGDPTVDRWEYVYFRDVNVVDATTIEFTTLLRGRRGTEVNTGNHALGDHVYLLRSVVIEDSGLQPRPAPAALRGSTLVWRAQGDGETANPAFDLTLPLLGNSLKPWAPAHYSVVLAGGNNLNISWVRRSRLASAEDVEDPPLGEATEAYVLEIYAGGSLVRTVTGLTSPAYTYTSANQVTDGFTPPLTTLKIAVYQISAVVGRGYTHVETVNVS